MSLPRFFARLDDAISPLLSGSGDLRAFLSEKSVCVSTPTDIEQSPVDVAGVLLATNLFARVYPRIRFHAPDRIVAECSALTRRINPDCEIELGLGPATATLQWNGRHPDATTVTVAPVGWTVVIDATASHSLQQSNVLTALAAGAIGAAEIFRQIFAEFLTNGRKGPTPAWFNLLTLADLDPTLPSMPPQINIGDVHLVGAGAIGQALVYALAALPVHGRLTLVDPERITLPNLQRYLLAYDDDIDQPKVLVSARALKNSKLDIVPRHAQWSVDTPAFQNAECVCTAVDTEALRIEIQAALPRRIYNAWTQPADIGWSRHETFGDEACLACLYWPTRARKNYHELIADALREHERRTLAYLTNRVPIDLPLTPKQLPDLPDIPKPPSDHQWFARSLLEDVADRYGLMPTDIVSWKGKLLGDLYHEGVCAGALIRHQEGKVADDVAVPLAHQSALAGIMMATQLVISSSPELFAHRPKAIEGRLNLLVGFPQISARPRGRTDRCICSDADFLRRYAMKWSIAVPDQQTAI